MSSIDRRVVEMEFDNRQFMNGIKDSLSALDQLKKGLALDGATKGLKGMGDASKGFNLDGIASAVDNISNKFSALGAIGFAALQRLTNAAIDLGVKMARKVIDPIFGGGKRRALNIEQAKFQFRGLGMDVDATMASALEAVQGTAYGLDEAAKAAGQFGASGMEAGDDMTSALRAISGVAAMTSSEYDDIANIFTKVAGNGRVMGDDLLRMSSRGLNAAATLADSLGISEQEVRQLVTEGQISFEMFYKAMDEAFGENATKANETYTGSLANMRAALARIGARGFTPWLEQQRDLFNSLSPAIDAVGTALAPVIDQFMNFTGRGTDGLIRMIDGFDFSRLTLVFTPLMAIFKNLYQAGKAFLLPIREAFKQIFPPKSLEDINAMLKAIQRFTARLQLDGDTLYHLQRVFAGFFAIFGIGWELVKAAAKFLGELFGVVFDGSSGFLMGAANVGDFLVALHEAVKEGKLFENFFVNLRKFMEPVINVLKRVGNAVSSLFDFDAPSSSGMVSFFKGLEPFAKLGEIIVSVWNRITSAATKAWGVMQPVVSKIREAFRDIGGALIDAFQTMDFANVLDVIKTGFLGGLLLAFRRFVENMSNGVGGAVGRLTAPFASLTFTLKNMQATLRAMTLLQIALAIGVMAASVQVLANVDSAGLSRALTALTLMFTQLITALALFTKIGGAKGLISTSAGLILLAVAVRILASSVKTLAELSWEELAKGLTGVTILIGSLTLAVRGMAGQTTGMIKAGAGLLLLSIGIKILASAVSDLSGLSWEEMAKGLVGVGTLLASLAIFTKLVETNKAGVLQGAGLVLLAAGIKILASAVKDFSGLNWEEIAKGLVSISGILAAFALFSRTVGNPAKLIASGIALVAVGAAMKILASAMADFGNLSWEEIAKGLLSMAGALTAITIAMNLMPPTMLLSAVALVAVSAALILIGKAMEQMGGMSWDEIARGLVTLAASLAIIAAATMLMTGALPGAAAILVVAAALRIFVPVLETLGNMSMREIATGLGTLAAVFIVLGVSGMLLAPVVPVLLGLGIAVGLLGVGMLAAGAGVLAFSIGLTALAAAGTAGVAAIVGIVAGLLGLLPMVATQIGLAIVAFANVIATAGPAIAAAMTAVIKAMVKAVSDNVPDILRLVRTLVTEFLALLVDLVPKIARAALQIMNGILQALVDEIPKIIAKVVDLVVSMLEELSKGVPQFVKSATALMVAFLDELANNIGKVITAAVDIVIAIVDSIAAEGVRLATAAANALIDFLNGLATAIRQKSGEIRAAGRNIAGAIIEGMTGGLSANVGKVATEARNVARSALSSAKNFLGIKSPSTEFRRLGAWSGEGMAEGLESSGKVISAAARHVGEETIEAMSDSIAGLAGILDSDLNLNPTITPVIDMSDVNKGVRELDSRLTPREIDVDVAYSKARDASIRYRALKATDVGTSTIPDFALPSEPAPTFVQNNYSPKALSAAEIYRQTQNQLSTSRGALTPNVTEVP